MPNPKYTIYRYNIVKARQRQAFTPDGDAAADGDVKVVGTEEKQHFTDLFRARKLNIFTTNIIILSPTFHRIVHRYTPRFNRDALCFEFENGVHEAVRLDRHLKRA